MLDVVSGVKGIVYMKRRKHEIPAKWAFVFLNKSAYITHTYFRQMGKRFWFHFWTPKWHEGRGPYLSVGLGIVAIYRGY
jgi:hypothetical protein